MLKVLIKNGRVWDGERFFSADLLTSEEKIAKIQPQIQETEADFVYDAKGKIVSAGLVDTHVHMKIGTPGQFGIQAEMSCFPFGVTAAADAGRSQVNSDVIDSFALKNVFFIGSRFVNNRLDRPALSAAIDRLSARAAGVKVYFDKTVAEVSDINALRESCDFAHEHSLPVMVHCSNSPAPMAKILASLQSGDILTHAFHGGVSNASEDNFESMIEAKRRGVIIDTGFAGNVHTDFAVFSKAIQMGVFPNTISTDITRYSAYMRGGRYGMTMCMAFVKKAGMPEEEILRAVTHAPATALGKADAWGHLKVGATADIAVLDFRNEGFDLTDRAGNRMASEEGYRCVLTLSDGQIVYRD